MNEPTPSALPDERWGEDFTRALRRQRSRVQEFLAALRERERSAQTELASLIERWRDLSIGRQPADGQAPADGSVEDEYRRRYEIALSDIRELKARNEELEQRLRDSLPGGAAHPGPSGKTLDWEAEKRRILAALEAESEPDGQPPPASRLEVKEILRATDQIVADKDREILELKRTLEDQSTSLASVAVGAAAVGAVLDQDAVVQEERENLRRLQDEWAEKLRKAEVEISIERAKLARERAEIDDKIRAFGGRPGKSEEPGDSAGKAPRSTRGRWLARLGLKEGEDAK